MSLPGSLLALASRQRSLFTLDDARRHAVTQDKLDGHVHRGELHRPHPRVYGLAGVSWPWERRLLAACLAGGPGTSATFRAAAHIWELLDLADPPLEISVPRWRSPRFAAGSPLVIHRPVGDLRHLHTVRRGVPVSNPLLTMVDLAAVASDEEIVDALDAGVAMRLFSLTAVAAARARLAKPGRPGTGRLAVHLEAQILGDRARSVLEARMARLWRRSGLPAATFQHVVRNDAGRFLARCDFAIVELRIAVEVDGWRTHSSPSAIAHDHRRRNRLLAAGWHVVTFTWKQVRDEPDVVAADVRAAISARMAA